MFGEILFYMPRIKRERSAAFKKVKNFWSSLGVRKLPNSEFYVLAPEYSDILRPQ